MSWPRRLAREGHSVTVMDKNATAFRRLPDSWDGGKVVGFGFDRDDLVEAGIEGAGAVAAVTSGDNTNILTARIARETFEVPQVVARIYDPRRAAIYQRLGIATVATVSWTVDQVARRLLPQDVASVWTDPSGEVNIVEYPLPEAFCGRSIMDLAEGDQFRPIMVTRARWLDSQATKWSARKAMSCISRFAPRPSTASTPSCPPRRARLGWGQRAGARSSEGVDRRWRSGGALHSERPGPKRP